MDSKILFTTKGTNKDSVIKSFIIAAICVILGLIVVLFTKDLHINPYRGSASERALASGIIVGITLAPFVFAFVSIAKAVIDNLRYIELYEEHIEGKKLAMNNYGYNDIYLKFDQINSVSVESGYYICINTGSAIYKARSSKAKEFMQVYNSHINSRVINPV